MYDSHTKVGAKNSQRKKKPIPANGDTERAPLAGPPSSRRGEALWEREGAGLGSLGAASSESGAASHWSLAADWQRDPGRAWPVLPRDVCLS